MLKRVRTGKAGRVVQGTEMDQYVGGGLGVRWSFQDKRKDSGTRG